MRAHERGRQRYARKVSLEEARGENSTSPLIGGLSGISVDVARMWMETGDLPTSLRRVTNGGNLSFLLIHPDYYRVTVARKSAVAKRARPSCRSRAPAIFGTSSERNPLRSAALPLAVATSLPPLVAV